jgi:DNA (cytosine-5)-methyltransferase 1
MKIAGLFAGIGGIELGLGEAGHQTVMTCENDSSAIAVLRAGLSVPNHDDISTLGSLPADIELISAGFPCQDLSQAGRTGGILGERSGLINEVFRLARAAHTPWVLIENVPFMLRLHQGAALEFIISNLEELGYRWAYRVVDTIAFGLPQRRQRVFVLASRVADPADVLLVDEAEEPPQAKGLLNVARGFYWTEGNRGLGWAVNAIPPLKNGSGLGIPTPPAILMPDGRIIKPDIRDAERLNGFRVDWTAPAETAIREPIRWRLVGNAVSVPVSAWIGNRLSAPGQYDRTRDLGQFSVGGWPKAARSAARQRVAVEISTAPVWRSRPPLHEFLKFPGTPLSVRAAEGFYLRARRSNLRFPEGFLAAVAAHIERTREMNVGKGTRGQSIRTMAAE